MTSERTYRKALAHEVAIIEIRDKSGLQFNSEAVDAFLKITVKKRVEIKW